MRVFISSVKLTLEEERRALPGLIRALGHEPVMFEDFTAQTDPSREACLKAVASADVVLLVLGSRYGWVFPETAQSATHDEFMEARRNGQTIYVFNKNVGPREPEQQAFVDSVGDYASGAFWKSFTDVPELLTQVAEAVREFESAPSPLTYEPLSVAPSVTWRSEWQTRRGWGGSEHTYVELHVTAVDGRSRSIREVRALPDAIIGKLRAYGAVTMASAVDPTVTDDHVTIDVPESDGSSRHLSTVPRRFAGLRVAKSGQVSVWSTLARAQIGAILTEDELAAAIGDQLRIIGAVDVLVGDRFALSVGLGGSMMVSLSSSSATTLGGLGGGETVRITPDESVSSAVFDVGAEEVSRGLARRIIASATR